MTLSERRERVFYTSFTLFVYGEKAFTIILYNDPMLHKTGKHNSHHDFNDCCWMWRMQQIFSTVILAFLNKYGSNLIRNTLYVSAAQ